MLEENKALRLQKAFAMEKVAELEAELARLRIESTEALASERAISTKRQEKVEQLEGEVSRLRSELELALSDARRWKDANDANREHAMLNEDRRRTVEYELKRLRSAGTFDEGKAK